MASNDSWTDVELSVAVEAYLYLCHLEHAGADWSEREMTAFLLGGPLKQRNDASVRYRMRNISSVFAQRGWSPLRAYSPANQVGSGVRVRIEAILDAHTSTELNFLKGNSGVERESRSETVLPSSEQIIGKLDQLRDGLSDLEGELVGIGHNNPPDPTHTVSLTADDVRAAREEVGRLRDEISAPVPDARAIVTSRKLLGAFGLKLATWIGERTTKFVDAALISIAPILIAKAMNVLPLISDAIGMLSRIMSH